MSTVSETIRSMILKESEFKTQAEALASIEGKLSIGYDNTITWYSEIKINPDIDEDDYDELKYSVGYIRYHHDDHDWMDPDCHLTLDVGIVWAEPIGDSQDYKVHHENQETFDWDSSKAVNYLTSEGFKMNQTSEVIDDDIHEYVNGEPGYDVPTFAELNRNLKF